MPSSKNEIELKFDATKVDTLAFVQWAMNRGPDKYEHVEGPDCYYSQGVNTVRHRWNIGGAGELTVKQRKSHTSTTDRVEIDLLFAQNIQIGDVTDFLIKTGWKRQFTLVKEAHIFWYSTPVPVTLVIYDVSKLDETGDETKLTEPMRFIEVEIEKGSAVTTEASLVELERWKQEISKWFAIGKVQDESLYEIYSGKRYTLEENDNATANASKGTNRRRARRSNGGSRGARSSGRHLGKFEGSRTNRRSKRR